MCPKSHRDAKKQTLKDQGVLHRHPETVRHELFLQNDFFDPRDLVQVKYEMLRRVHVEGESVSESADTFGFSRPSFYKAQEGFGKGGLCGLLPRRRGPRRAHKLSEEVMDYVTEHVQADESLRAPALSKLVKKQFGLSVHPRSIERALVRRQKKR